MQKAAKISSKNNQLSNNIAVGTKSKKFEHNDDNSVFEIEIIEMIELKLNLIEPYANNAGKYS